ncbi:hypothetical protein BDV93DRAFT_520100 [Ceratobasidium sp. AG-I]|nr:hypothetical protein BDV93DRAFT_520100 [Ceratobasidium sp. AG-I]
MVSRLRSGSTGPSPDVVPWNNTPSIEYLDCFTHTNRGFSAFLHAATNDSCREVVNSAIAEFVHLAANPRQVLGGGPIELRVAAVPGFLDVVSVVAKHCSGNSERQQMLLDFSGDVATLLDVAAEVSEAHKFIVQHTASNDLCSALEKIDEETSLERLDQLQELMAKLGIKRTVQEDVTTEPSAEHSDVDTLTDTTASDDEDADQPVDDEVVLSGNEEENTVR